MSSREGLKVLNDTKLVLNDSLIVWDHLGNIQNLQMSPILQTSFLVWTFFSRSLQQDGSKHFQWVDITPNSIFKQCLQWFSSAASSGLLWFYALAPNNSSIALASMQAAATSNSERFSPRRCRRATSREPCAGALRPSARRNHRARLPRRRKPLLSATVASAAHRTPIGSPAFKPGTATWPSVSAAMSRCCLDSH